MIAVALDDELPALEIITAFCKRAGIELLATFTKSSEAFQFINQQKPDLLFLDIQMPNVSGLEFVNFIPKQTLIIFTTSYTGYAVQSYNLDAVDYLLKPFSYDRFLIAIEKAKQRFSLVQPSHKPDNTILLHTGPETIRINLNEILFIKASDNYLSIALENKKPLLIRATMQEMEEKLPAQDFMRVHRSYIIAIKKIHSTDGKKVVVHNEQIPVGKNFMKDFATRIKGLMG